MSARQALRSFVASRPVATVAIAGIVFSAAGFGAAVTVSETTFSAIFGGITSVGTSLQVTSTSIGVVKATTSAAASTQGTATELGTGASGAGNTALTRSNWQYKVVIEETAVAAVTTGTFSATLYVDDVSKGTLYFTQGTANDLATEGATLRWDIGADLPTGDTSYRVEILAA